MGPCNLTSNAKLGVQYLYANNYLDAIFVHAGLGEGQGHPLSQPSKNEPKIHINYHKL